MAVAAPEGRARRVLRWHLLATLLSLLVVAAAMMVGEWVIAQREAHRDAEGASLRVADAVGHALARTDFGAGAAPVRRRVERVMEPHFAAGSIVRIKVWRIEGDQARVVFSDERRVEGDRRRFSPELADRLQGGRAVVLPVPNDVEHRHEAADAADLREVYLAFVDAAGADMRLELYVPVRAREAMRQALSVQVPIIVGGLAVLMAMLIPLSLSLSRRLGQLADQRVRAIEYGRTAREDERRELARRLHDGIIQDIAGVSMVIMAEAGRERASDINRASLGRAGEVLRRDTHALRDVMVAFHDRPVTAAELGDALRRAAERLSTERMSIAITLRGPVAATTDERADAIHRVATELLRNAARHSGAGRVDLGLCADGGGGLRLVVADDGRGLDEAERRREGHIGLAIVEHTIAELGGHTRIAPGEGGGTRVEIRLPPADG